MNESMAMGSSLPLRREPLVPSNVLGMSLFVITEVMFFMALVSAYVVIKAGAGTWAPPSGAILPVAVTAVNTLVLITSGVLFYLAGREMRDIRKQSEARLFYLQAVVLGAVFVSLQGYEWVSLLAAGMTFKANIFSTCFYFLIGTHALHAVAAVLIMAWYYMTRVRHGRLSISQMTSLQILWFFVVGIWPVLYGLVYF